MNRAYCRSLGVTRTLTSFSPLERTTATFAGTLKQVSHMANSLLSQTGPSRLAGTRTTPTSLPPHHSTARSRSKPCRTPRPTITRPLRIIIRHSMAKISLPRPRHSLKFPSSPCLSLLAGSSDPVVSHLASVAVLSLSVSLRRVAAHRRLESHHLRWTRASEMPPKALRLL